MKCNLACKGHKTFDSKHVANHKFVGGVCNWCHKFDPSSLMYHRAMAASPESMVGILATSLNDLKNQMEEEMFAPLPTFAKAIQGTSPKTKFKIKINDTQSAFPDWPEDDL